jgi:hypothetical protein
VERLRLVELHFHYPFKSCLPDHLKAAASQGNPYEPRPSSLTDTPPRTTGAPNPVTPGAADAAVAADPRSHEVEKFASAVDLPSAIPAFLEACGKLAGEAAACGDWDRARELIAVAARVAASLPSSKRL